LPWDDFSLKQECRLSVIHRILNVLILRLFPVAFLAVALTACSSVQSAPPSTSYSQSGSTADRQALGSISDPSMPGSNNSMILKSAVNAGDTPYDFNETNVSRKIAQLRSDKDKIQNFYTTYDSSLKDLNRNSEQTSQEYYTSIAMINARLQAGTTPGNPILVEQARSAQTKLERIESDINTLTSLSSDISSNASVAAYLLEAVRATYGLSGAVDEDHVALTQLEDEVNRLVVQIDRQLTDVNNDINRRTSYLSTERRNLQTLTLAISNGELYGQSLANRAFFSPSTAMPGDPDLASAKMGAANGGNFNSSKPLVVIRFDRPNVDYQQAVYTATSEALQRYPNVSFEVVAVAPPGSNPAQGSLANSDAQKDAQDVVRSLTQMGIPGNRIKVSSTRSPQARSPEVHIFLR
jgi:hypothetical protein